MNTNFYKEKDIEILKEIKERRKIREEKYEDRKEYIKKYGQNYPKSLSFQECNESNLEEDHDYETFEYNSYNFVNFKNKKWGNNSPINRKVKNKSFLFVTFTGCRFENIVFDNCKFYGCKFVECTTNIGKVIFENCCFEGLFFSDESSIKSICCEFIDSSYLNFEFKKSSADSIIFENCSILGSRIEESNFNNSIFIECSFNDLVVSNTKLDNLSIIKMKNYKIQFYDNRNIPNLDTEVYISKIGLPEKNCNRENFINISKMYYSIMKVLRDSTINDEYAREYSYLYNYFSMKSKIKVEDKIIPYLSWLFFGFGERMKRSLLWFATLITSSAILYFFNGIRYSNGQVIDYSIKGTIEPVGEIIIDFFKCLHFSIITFATVGYGNVTPYGASLWISGTQVIMSLIYIALLTSIIVKRFLK